MNIIDLTKRKFSNNRFELRKEIINIFLEESPGTGKGCLASRNKYTVKNIGENQVYLQRPAQFNNGFDFTLNVSGINFNDNYYNDKSKLKRSTTRPSHEHIYADLRSKKEENLQLYKELLEQINKIYNCQEPNKTKFDFISGYKSEVVLECVKWLLIEQDITYWHYSGRAMFYEGIQEI